MRTAFAGGAGGIDPVAMKVTLTAIAVGLILVIAVWVGTQLMDAYRNDQLRSADVAGGFIKLVVLIGVVLFIIV